ncbi:MAG: hypothetical protein CSB06_03700 [Bacteroidia bacterium]|nr:MAG: hypothetical protein CSB06_03700 [Bacteroidia bacterium]
MAIKKAKNEIETLEQYRIALENVYREQVIAQEMHQLGYGQETIEKGKQLLEETRQAYDARQYKSDQESASYDRYAQRKKELEKFYGLHRKKAKIIFRKEPMIMERLELDSRVPAAYLKWLETVKKFYTVSLSDELIQAKLLRLRVTEDELHEGNKRIEELEELRAEYLKAKGIAQDSTKHKDAAFNKLDDWMSEFYSVARIALEENQQLLESLGKFVRS